MHPIVPIERSAAPHPSGVAASLMEVVTELTATMTEENALLAAGYPAGLSATSDRKVALSDAYADLWDEICSDATRLLAGDPGVLRDLTHAVVQLRAVAVENSARLMAAMAASRQRVEAVLEVLGSECRSTWPTYGVNGAVPPTARLPYLSADYHA